MRYAPAVKSVALAAACSLFMMSGASAGLSCKGSLDPARSALAADVGALRTIEQEASDRAKGFDSRPFAVLRDEARRLAASIGPADILELEKTLRRCRNRTYPIHTVCAGAASALADLLDKYAATPKPDYDKAAFAGSMKECEWLMKLPPLKSAIRGTD
jgi:hypothetical protein